MPRRQAHRSPRSVAQADFWNPPGGLDRATARPAGGLGTTGIMLAAGRLTDRYGGGAVALAGTLGVLVSTAPLPWLDPGTPMVLVQSLLAVRGAGLGLAMMPAMTAAYASVAASELDDATALVNIVLRVGGALGAALCVIVLSRGLAAADTAAGFSSAFVSLGAICLLAVLAAGWLYQAEHPDRDHRSEP